MSKKLILVLSLLIAIYSQSIAQNTQSAHQLTPSCYIATDGKVIINAGGQITTAASANVFLRDSLRGSIYDTISSTFKNNKRVYYSYDAGGLLMESASKSLDKSGLVWGNSQQILYKYTGSQLLEETYKTWDKTLTDWANFIKYKYSYETDNTLSSIFNQPWAVDSAEWEYSTKDLISYNQNNYVTSVANQKWNKNLGSWDNFLRINFTYSGSLISEKIYQVWNKSAQLWEDYQKETITYSNSKISEIKLETKTATTAWENYSRKVFVNTNNLTSEITEYVWYGSWKDSRKYAYTYDANSMLTVAGISQWADNLSAYRNVSMDEMYYSQHQVFGVNETPADKFLVKSPLSKQEAFSLDGLKDRTKYQMKLISLNGSIVIDRTITNGQRVVLGSQVSNGIYLISFTTPGLKPVIQKVLITD
jgi:hypothetical protein